MAQLKIILVSGNFVAADSTSEIMTPQGKVLASSLGSGDWICLSQDGTNPAEIDSIEEVS